jgi:hypothetical protein
MRKAGTLLVVALASALTACVPSVYPLYTDKELRFDPGLLGTWGEDGTPDESWTFTKAGDTSYTLVVKDGDGSGRFEAHLLQLGKYRFLDLVPDDDALDKARLPGIYMAALIPGHMFLRVSSIEPTLKVAFLSEKWLATYLDDHPKDLASRRLGTFRRSSSSMRRTRTHSTAGAT